jgi:hypothetical protein
MNRHILILTCMIAFSGCTRPLYVNADRYPALTSTETVTMTMSPDKPAPTIPRFAMTIRQIGVGSQSDLNSAISQGISNARSIGANHIHVAISEPETRRQKVEISFFYLGK